MNILFWLLVLFGMFIVWYFLSAFFTRIGEKFIKEKNRLENIINDSKEDN